MVHKPKCLVLYNSTEAVQAAQAEAPDWFMNTVSVCSECTACSSTTKALGVEKWHSVNRRWVFFGGSKDERSFGTVYRRGGVSLCADCGTRRSSIKYHFSKVAECVHSHCYDVEKLADLVCDEAWRDLA